MPSLKPRLAHWLLWCAIAVHVPIALVATRHAPEAGYDFDNFYKIATQPGRPYVDVPVEFPVGTVQVFRTLGSTFPDRGRFGVSLVIISAVADVAIVGALYWGWGIAAAAGYALVVIPLLDLFLLRTDLWSTAIATIAVAAWRRERRVLSALGFAAGAAFKLWPLLFLPLLLVPSRGRLRVAPLVAAMAGGLVVLGGWLLVAGTTGLYQVLTFRGARGWEIESTVGAVWMLIDQSTMRIEAGAWRIGSTSGPISILLFALGGMAALWMIWRGARSGHVGAGWAGGISSLLVLSALLSPQVLGMAGAGERGGVGRGRQTRRHPDRARGVHDQSGLEGLQSADTPRDESAHDPARAQRSARRSRARCGTARHVGAAGIGTRREPRYFKRARRLRRASAIT